jgi:anti-anti-sigma regulatory factor
VIDMHGVTFMDSTGFGVLVLVNLRATRTGTPVTLPTAVFRCWPKAG